MILFQPRGGDSYFQKAQNIVNNAPEGSDISGWKTFDGVRNRYRLIENLRRQRYTWFTTLFIAITEKG